MEEGSHQQIENESKATKDDEDELQEAVATTVSAAHSDTIIAGNSTSGRSYECMYCKRGFSTAQALGGHMNIHRKDRTPRVAKSSSSAVSASSNRHRDGHYQPYAVHRRSDASYGGYLAHDQHPTYINQYVKSTLTEDDDDPRKRRELSLFSEELQLGLGIDHGDDGKLVVDRRVEIEGEEEAEQVDLELRLGHDQ